MKEKISIGFIGHRPKDLWGFDLTVRSYSNLQTKLEAIIMNSLKHYQVVECHSTMDIGTSLIWTQAILRCKFENKGRVKLIVHLVNDDQAKKWKPEHEDLFENLIERADDIIDYDKQPTIQNIQMRNIAMMSQVNIPIILWDGRGKRDSNTWLNLRQLMELNSKIVHIHPQAVSKHGILRYNVNKTKKLFQFVDSDGVIGLELEYT